VKYLVNVDSQVVISSRIVFIYRYLVSLKPIVQGLLSLMRHTFNDVVSDKRLHMQRHSESPSVPYVDYPVGTVRIVNREFFAIRGWRKTHD